MINDIREELRNRIDAAEALIRELEEKLLQQRERAKSLEAVLASENQVMAALENEDPTKDMFDPAQEHQSRTRLANIVLNALPPTEPRTLDEIAHEIIEAKFPLHDKSPLRVANSTLLSLMRTGEVEMVARRIWRRALTQSEANTDGGQP